MLQYSQTDRVKTLAGAALLTEVIRERDEQLKFKAAKYAYAVIMMMMLMMMIMIMMIIMIQL